MATQGGPPDGAGGGGGAAAAAAHLFDQPEEDGVAFLRADEVKKACEEFAQAMKESTMAEMIRHYKKGLNNLIELGAGGYRARNGKRRFEYEVTFIRLLGRGAPTCTPIPLCQCKQPSCLPFPVSDGSCFS